MLLRLFASAACLCAGGRLPADVVEYSFGISVADRTRPATRYSDCCRGVSYNLEALVVAACPVQWNFFSAAQHSLTYLVGFKVL